MIAAAGVTRRKVLFVMTAFLLLYLPFLNKAFHIDDAVFLDAAEMIGFNPLRGQAVDYPSVGVMLHDFLPYDISHPLLIPYLIKLLAGLFGYNEAPLHAAFLVFPLLAILGMVLLWRSLLPEEGHIHLLILFVLSAPAFLVNSHNVMTDVPTTAFLVMAIALFRLAMERKRARLCYGAGAFLALAVFSSYQALLFVPLVLLYALFTRRLSRHVFFALSLPPILLLGWFLAVYRLYGIFPLLKSSIEVPGLQMANFILNGLSPQMLGGKAAVFLAHLGSSAFPVLLLSAILGGRYIPRLAMLLASFAAALFAAVQFTGYALAQNLLLAVQIAFGVSVVLSITAAAFAEKDKRKRGVFFFLLSWFYLVFAYCMAVLPFGAARYLLPALPPVFMILLCRRKTDAPMAGGARLATGALVVIALANGLAGAYSDYFYAGTYRTFARESQSIAEARRRGARVWFVGEWGFRYYMERAGGRYLTAGSNEPRRGDIVVIPDMAALWQPSVAVRWRTQPLRAVRYTSPLPLKTFNARSRAGFYHHNWGLLSFAFSWEPDEYIRVVQVVR